MNYEIKPVNGPKRDEIVHVARLKRYRDREDQNLFQVDSGGENEFVSQEPLSSATIEEGSLDELRDERTIPISGRGEGVQQFEGKKQTGRYFLRSSGRAVPMDDMK